jgi:hypothetical protein
MISCCTSPVPGQHVGTQPGKLVSQIAAIRKSCRVQSAVPRVELGVALGQEELLVLLHPIQGQFRRRRQQLGRHGCLVSASSADEPHQVPVDDHQKPYTARAPGPVLQQPSARSRTTAGRLP